MAKPRASDDVVADLLQKLLIIELAKEGVPQGDIAKIVGVGKTKVNSLLKDFKPKKTR